MKGRRRRDEKLVSVGADAAQKAGAESWFAQQRQHVLGRARVRQAPAPYNCSSVVRPRSCHSAHPLAPAARVPMCMRKSSTPRSVPPAKAHWESMTSMRLCSTWYIPRSPRGQICTNCQRLLAPESLPRKREPPARAPANAMLPKFVPTQAWCLGSWSAAATARWQTPGFRV